MANEGIDRPYMDARDIAAYYRQNPRKINPEAVTEHFRAGAERTLNKAKKFSDFTILNEWLCQYKMMKIYFWDWVTSAFF